MTGYQYLPSLSRPEGNCTAYVYDSAGNVTDTYAGQASPCDGHTGGIHTASRFQGDPGVSCGAKTGQVCSVINGNGGTTAYGYDSNGNLTSVTPPSPGGGYDHHGRCALAGGEHHRWKGAEDNVQLRHGGSVDLDPLQRCHDLHSEHWQLHHLRLRRGWQSPERDRSEWDRGLLLRRPQPSDPSRSSTTSACAGSSPSGITYSYDGVGNQLSYCDSGGTTTYAYDPDNRLLSIAEPGGSCGSTPSLCTTFGYNTDGNRTTITFPGGAIQTTVFDNAQNVTSVVGKSSTGSALTSFSYTYTNGANDLPMVQTAIENDPVASNTYSYSYDALNRLSGASVTSGGGSSYAYTYDADNNLLTRAVGSATTTYAYNAADQLCWSYSGTSSNGCSSAPGGATTYSFDADGNETGNSTGAWLSYNPKNQTTSITYGGTTLSGLSYSDQGEQNRVAAGATTFDNTAVGPTIATSGSTSTYYLRDDIGNVIGERQGSAHYYFLTDREGSVVAVITGDGQTVADRYGYDPYGSRTYSSGTVNNPFGYAGGYTDPTGLIKFGTRYYDPATSRWTQVDLQMRRNPMRMCLTIQSTKPTAQGDRAVNETPHGFVRFCAARANWLWVDYQIYLTAYDVQVALAVMILAPWHMFFTPWDTYQSGPAALRYR